MILKVVLEALTHDVTVIGFAMSLTTTCTEKIHQTLIFVSKRKMAAPRWRRR